MKADPYNFATAFDKGNSNYEQENYNEANKDYILLLKNGFYSKELYLNLGNSFYKLDSLPQAILYYEKSIDLNPINSNSYFNLGFIYHNSDFEKAVSYYQKAARLGNIDSWNWLNSNGYLR